MTRFISMGIMQVGIAILALLERILLELGVSSIRLVNFVCQENTPGVEHLHVQVVQQVIRQTTGLL